MSIKEQVRAALDIEHEVVDIPVWGDVKIEVRSMTGRARSRLLKDAVQDDGSMDFEAFYPRILIATCYDPDTGEAVFDAGDVDWLNDKAAGPVEKLARAGMRLSGLSEKAVDEGKDSSS